MTLMYFGWIIASLLIGLIAGVCIVFAFFSSVTLEKDNEILKYKKKILELQNVIQELKK